VQKLARLASVFSVVFVFAFPCIGQRTPGANTARFRILGTVTSEADHSPIQGVQLRLSTSEGELMTTTTSRQNGEFDFENIPGGEFTVAVLAEGYDPYQETFLLRALPEVRMEISLRKTKVGKGAGVGAEKAVSARELSLPVKTKEALAKAREHLYQKRDYEGSLPFFRKVHELSPGFYEAYYDEGIAYTFLQRPADAEEAFRKSIAGSEGHYAEPLFAMASLRTDQKQFPEAQKFARDGLNIQPDSWRGFYELARVLVAEGHPADAEKYGLEARKRKTDFPALYLILANIHMQLHNNEAVLDDVNAFLKLEPDGPSSAQARKIKDQMERTLGRSPSPPALSH
jgi:tetratricopeptide (TPR) repeat protein